MLKNNAEADRFELSHGFLHGSLASCCHTIRRRFQKTNKAENGDRTRNHQFGKLRLYH